MRPGRTGFVIAALAALAICVTGIAWAAGKPVKDTVNVPPGAEKTATAKCKHHTRPALLGFDSTVDANHATVLEGLDPGNSSVKATARTFYGTGGKMTAIAFCSKHKPFDIVTPPLPTVVPPGGSEEALVSCPTDAEHVQIGGLRIDDTSPYPLISFIDRTGPHTWTVEVRNPDGVTPIGVTPVIGCSRAPAPRKVEKTVSQQVDNVGMVTATAKCPNNKNLVMAGFALGAVDDAGPYIKSMVPNRTRGTVKVKAWMVEGSEQPLSADAYCR